MVELDEQQIGSISVDIDGQGLTYTGLKDELLDHICCQVELAMEKGMTFNEAYQHVKIVMGRKRIRQIQDETLYLISKKYRRMKRTMFALGVLAPILILAGLTFKVMHWPGAGILNTAALFITGMIFLPLFVMVRIRDTRNMGEPIPMTLYISGMVPAMITILGAICKLQHWPGAGIMLTIGLSGLALVFLPVFAITKIREGKKMDEEVNKKLILGGVLAGILVILGSLFKIMHWPGAGIVLLVSWSLVAVILLPLLVLNVLKKSENQLNNFLLIILTAVTVSILVLVYVRSASREAIVSLYFPENNLNYNAMYLDRQTAYDWDDLMASGNTEKINKCEVLVKEADEIKEYIFSVKDRLISFYEDESNPWPYESAYRDLLQSHNLANDYEPLRIIAKEDEYRLYHLLVSYRDHALLLTTNPELEKYIKRSLVLMTWKRETSPEAWAEFYFQGPTMKTVTILSMYLSSVKLIEHEILTETESR